MINYKILLQILSQYVADNQIDTLPAKHTYMQRKIIRCAGPDVANVKELPF